MSKEIRQMIDKVKNFKQFVNENYDLVSQFKGDHHGNPMEKNKYLNALGLDEDGIKTIEIWINTMKTTINEFVNSQDKIKLGDFVSHSKEMPRLVGRVVSWDYENDNYVNVDYDGVIRNQRIDMLFKV
jgi:hypothetical protein